MIIHSATKGSIFLLLSCLFSNVEGQDMKTLTDMEKQRVEAIEARAFDFVTGLYADDFKGVTAAGKQVDKAQLMEQFRTNSPHIHFSAEDVQVRIFGNIALVTGKQLSKSKMGSVIGQVRYILVLSKKEDLWKIIESQETIIVE